MAMGIRLKMFLGFGFMVAILLAVGIYGNSMFSLLSSRTAEIADSWMPRVQSVERIRSLVSEYRRWELSYIISNDSWAKAENEKNVGFVNFQLTKQLQKYESLITTDEEKVVYGNFIKQWDYYKTLHKQMVDLSVQNDVDSAMKIMVGESEIVHQKISDLLDTLVKVSENGAANAKEESNQIFEKTKKNSVIVIVAGLLLAVIVAYIIALSIIKPTRSLLLAARAMAGGDLAQKVEVRVNDEIGELAGAFNEMCEKLRIIVGRISENSESLAASSQELSASGQEVSASVEEMAETTTEVAALSEMGAAGAREAAAKAGKAMETADRGMLAVKNTDQAMKSIHDSSANASGSVRQLNDFTDKIGNITELITSVAEQTNLLALNAAIEAARAGDHGRGFAVVADEVRNLAEQSEKAARDIAALISRVQSETEKAVLAMDTVINEISGGVRVVTDTGHLFEEIIEQMRETVENVGEVVEGSVKSSQGIRQLAESTRQINMIIRQVSESANEFAVMSGDLQRQVDQFKM